MRALVVYETIWGNTEQIARAIATGLRVSMTVEIVDSESAPTVVNHYDLVVVGGPTHAFSMTRSSTREGAVAQRGAPRAPAKGIREWLVEVTPPGRAVSAATFDTRVNAPRLPGSAAKAAKRELKELGFNIVAKQKSFRVHGYEGPLLDGELERAEQWGRELATVTAHSGTEHP
ncbi:flavodoxin family protein [Leifsonia kafniensis]|uniref:Flavodoxin family protein n=1 Tax=Leifsonia kafniensis TaxID=475957 RepID=A0ABP7KB09_9MICO